MSRSRRVGFTHGTAAIVLMGLICLPPRASQSQAIVLDLTNLVQNILIAVQGNTPTIRRQLCLIEVSLAREDEAYVAVRVRPDEPGHDGR